MGRRSVRIDYTNHRGERRVRKIEPRQFVFGSSKWHRDLQWILYAIDLDSGEERGFAMKDVHSWEPVHEEGA